MFKNKHVRALLKDSLRDLTLKPKLTALYYLGPIRQTVERQTLPIISATLIDGFTKEGQDFNWQIYVFWYVVINVVSLFILFINRMAWHKLDEHIATERFPRYLKQVFDFPYELLVNKTRGDIMSKYRSKVEFSTNFNLILNDVLRIFLNLIVTFIVIYSRNKSISLIYVLFWIISAVSLYQVAKSRIEINKVANEAWDEYFGKLADLVGNAETTKYFNSQKAELKKIHSQGKVLWAKFTLRWLAARKNQNLISSIQIGTNVLLAIFGIYSVAQGNITIGTYVLLQTYVNYAIGDIATISDITRMISENITRAVSIDELTDKYPSLPEPTKPLQPNEADSTIEFRNVNFKYSDGKESALKDFNLVIKNGQKVGIVGKSGAGKSTITKLLLRMYAPDSGNILIGGKDTMDMGSDNTRKCIAYVPQDPILFHRSIKENIAYARPSTGDKLIEKVAKQAHCTEFIEKLKDGFDSRVGDKGVKLSGGQRQRVAIARAILKDSPLLLFDEATSALDSESESIIQDALNNVMKNKTSIVIAHRLSTLKHMDRIVVIDDGQVVEDGTHQDLLKKDGIYAGLWSKQSGGFIEA